jgi:2-keto-4-pentenoate hydratase
VTDGRVLAGLREQLVSWRAELQGGARRIGWKIGFNLPAVQEALGIDECAIGYLTSATLLEGGADYSAAGATRLVAEPEVAIEIGADGGIASYAPAIELADFNRPLEELQAIVAEDIFHRGLILGASRPSLSARPEARVLVNEQERASDQAPEDYFDGVVELTGRLLGAEGESLHPGDRIICGVITAPVEVGAGDAVTVDFGELGNLSVRIRD